MNRLEEIRQMMKKEILIYALAAVIGVLMAFFIVRASHAYTIVDTVYVEDSITVTMDTTLFEQQCITYYCVEYRAKPKESDSGRLLYIFLDTTISTACTDTLNTENLYEEL